MVELNKVCNEFQKIGVEFKTNLKNPKADVSYVTVMELPERKNYFKKNGIVLSTFQAFESTEVIIDQIEWLQKQGIIGIGFHEIYHKTVPEIIIEYCQSIDMLLFSIPTYMPYHKIQDSFNQMENEDFNLRSYEIYRLNDKILESILQEKDAGYLINLIGNHIKENIIYLDLYMKVQATWRNKETSQKQIDQLTMSLTSAYKEKLLQARFSTRNSIIHLNQNKYICSQLEIIPIASKNNFIGYLIVEPKVLTHSFSNEVVRMAVRAITMLGSKVNMSDHHLKLKDVQKFETLIGNESNKLDISDFYIEIANLRYCLRITFKDESILDNVVSSVNALLFESHANSLAWSYRNTLIAFIESDETLVDIKNILSVYSGYQMGLSSGFKSTTLKDLSKMNQQALTSMRAAVDNQQSMVHWDEVGVERVVYNIEDSSLLRQLDIEALYPVLEYDKKRDGELLDTLKQVLEHFFNVQAIADNLYIHPNTVRYRINKINELLDMNIMDSSKYALLVIAIKMYEMNKK